MTAIPQGAERRPARCHQALFLALAALTLLPVVTPAPGLALGALLGVTLGNPFTAWSSNTSTWLLKACVVGLGFGTSLPSVLAVGRVGLWATAIGIAFTLVVGLSLGRLIGVDRITSALISGGTAICGGSAIAALAPALGASREALAVSLATVFVLNGVALYTFPAIGHALELSQSQFALWAAVAIHDTSSVVGAASTYGREALAEATVIKLTRALWIVPLALGAGWWRRRATGGTVRVAWPWFIGLFALASAIRATLPAGEYIYAAIVMVARQGLVLTLFLIGAGLSRSTLRRAGARPLIQGLLLWLVVGVASLFGVLRWPPLILPPS